MYRPEKELIALLKESGTDFTSSLPCEKIKRLLEYVPKNFFNVPLTREEEGVGISAGAALAGKKPAMFVQSSGIGNMMNALLSLTAFYGLPLAIFVSQRGIYKEKIAAQVPMGKRLPGILKAAGISFSSIRTRDDFRIINKRLADVYKKNSIHAFLLSPSLFERSSDLSSPVLPKVSVLHNACAEKKSKITRSGLRRYEILKNLSPFLCSKLVICNLGIPSKELFQILPQPSNFYMLGSMGMTTPIGLGVALSTKKEVVVIDGDGSLLMNPGTLATVAHTSPSNLVILAIDNGSYGSTGDQPTLTSSCVDLESVARGFGIRNTIKASNRNHLLRIAEKSKKGPLFVHILASAGNEPVANIPLGNREIKKQFEEVLSSD